MSNGYKSPDEELDFSFLSQIFDDDMPTIFAGDLNAWHLNLKSGPTSNKTGDELVDWTNDNLITNVSGGLPTCYKLNSITGTISKRQLDIWMVNEKARNMVCSKSSVDEFYGSDHLVTHLEILTNIPVLDDPIMQRLNKEPRFNFYKANWDGYRADLAKLLQLHADPATPKIDDPINQIDHYYEKILFCINSAADKNVPKCEAGKLPDWHLTKEIANALESKNKLERLLTQHPGDHNIKTTLSLVKGVCIMA